MSNVPGANNLPVRQNRQLVDKQIKSYSELTRKVEDDLRLAFTYCQLHRKVIITKVCPRIVTFLLLLHAVSLSEDTMSCSL